MFKLTTTIHKQTISGNNTSQDRKITLARPTFSLSQFLLCGVSFGAGSSSTASSLADVFPSRLFCSVSFKAMYLCLRQAPLQRPVRSCPFLSQSRRHKNDKFVSPFISDHKRRKHMSTPQGREHGQSSSSARTIANTIGSKLCRSGEKTKTKERKRTKNESGRSLTILVPRPLVFSFLSPSLFSLSSFFSVFLFIAGHASCI